MSLSCPENENSTDCLLRQLIVFLERRGEVDDAKFDWDPMTFAFTVPIGILAAVFALVAIVLAILAAGLGRNKCSKHVIGMWSRKTQGKWEWRSMRRISVAETPLLTASSLVGKLDKVATANSGSQAENWAHSSTAAAWLMFLGDLGLGHVDIPLSKRTTADFIPDDLKAVPAYGEVGTIISLAAAAGAESIETNSGWPYPLVIGDGFQLDFRQHPILGTVASFARYQRRRDSQPLPSQEHIRLALEHASGLVEVRCGFITIKRSAPNVSMIRNSLMYLHAMHGDYNHDNAQQSFEVCCTGSLFGGGDKHSLLWIVAAVTPASLPAVFPSKAANLSRLPSVLALQGRYWARPIAALLEEKEPSILRVGNILWMSRFRYNFDQQDADALLSRLCDGELWKNGLGVLLTNRENDVPWLAKLRQSFDIRPLHFENSFIPAVGIQPLLQACLKLLYQRDEFEKWFSALPSPMAQVYRCLALLQLREIDRWLAGRRAKSVACGKVSLYCRTVALLDLNDAVRGGSSAKTSLELGTYSMRPELAWELKSDHASSWTLLTRVPTDVISSYRAALEKVMILEPTSYERFLRVATDGDEGFCPFPGAAESLIFDLQRVAEQCRDASVLYLPKSERENPFFNHTDNLRQSYAAAGLPEIALDNTANLPDPNEPDNAEALAALGAVGDPDEANVSEDTDVSEDAGDSQDADDSEDSYDSEGAENPDAFKRKLNMMRREHRKRLRRVMAPPNDKQEIDNMLIWRCLLLVLLFSTAPDNSDILSSGLWAHTIPIL